MTDPYKELREGLERLKAADGVLRGPEADVAALLAERDTQEAEIGRLHEARQMPMDKPSAWPMTAGQFETATEYIAMELAERDGHEGDDKHTLIWEGSPPEPWGEVWQRYIPDAEALLSAGIAGIQEGERRGMAEDVARAALSRSE